MTSQDLTYVFKDNKDLAEFFYGLAETSRKRRANIEKLRGKNVREWHVLTAEMHAYWNTAEVISKVSFQPTEPPA